MNPALVQQGASLVGLELPQHSAEPAEKTPNEDQLSQFLAQYPFAPQQDSPEIVPAASVPLVVVPEPSEPTPIPVAESVPTPTIEPAAPDFVAEQPPTSWDGEVAEPIYAAPVVEQVVPIPVADSSDWSGPAQPYQEPAPAPQQSVYAAPLNNSAPNNSSVFDSPQETMPVEPDPFAVGMASSSNFKPTSYSPPASSPVTQPPPPAAPIQNQNPLPVPAAQSEDVPMYGTEMVARVGRHVILMGDVLPKLRRTALLVVDANLKNMSEEDRKKVPQSEINQVINTFVGQQYPAMLQEQIHASLVFNDYDMSKSKAEKDFLYENMGKEFDRVEVPAMMKEFKTENMAEFKQFLAEQLGSSLDREKRLWVQEQIVRQWIGLSVQRATGECTHDEMLEFYEAHKEMFTTPARSRWQELVVFFANYGSEQEAMDKIRWMGNQTAGGAPFEEIAKANSDGLTASKGGVWDWTGKGSLTSPELEQAIFTQPIGDLSPAIIRSDKGLHIIRVLERQEVQVVPFVEAQVTIREKIRSQRIQRYQEEYFSDLRRRFPTVVLKERIDFNVVDAGRTAAR